MKHVYIIAEAGVNHNGDMNIARRLIDEAKKAGADAIKFQTFTASSLVCKNAKKAEYQLESTNENETQYDMLKKLELTLEQHIELAEYSQKIGITFLSTPFDIESIQLLEKIGMSVYKIPSGEITNLPYLREIGKLNKRVIMSTGMCTMQEVEAALRVLRECGCEDVSLLHCNTQYPTPMSDVNLDAMITMKKKFNISIGYSDHTVGIEVPIAAVALGAEIIEKHFTVDKSLEGPDQRMSLEPLELQQMVQAIRNIEQALGSSEKRLTASEQANKLVVRKSIVAKKQICKGEFFSEDNLTTKRPGTGISPMLWDEIIGQRAIREFQEDEIIEV